MYYGRIGTELSRDTKLVRQIPKHPRKDTNIPNGYFVYIYQTVVAMGLPIVSQRLYTLFLDIYRWAPRVVKFALAFTKFRSVLEFMMFEPFLSQELEPEEKVSIYASSFHVEDNALYDGDTPPSLEAEHQTPEGTDHGNDIAAAGTATMTAIVCTTLQSNILC